MPNILLLSDNEHFATDLIEQIKIYAPEFNVFRTETVDDVIDVLVLDEKSEFLKDLRIQHPKSPIIRLIRLEDSVEDNPLNISIFKPLDLADFFNQLKSSINKLSNSSDGYLFFSDYELRPSLKEIFNKSTSKAIKLTEKEVMVLRYLYKAQSRMVSKNELLKEVWEYSPEVTTHTIETHIYRLRQKVESASNGSPLIITEGGGYKLQF